jgi:hypothetical protein
LAAVFLAVVFVVVVFFAGAFFAVFFFGFGISCTVAWSSSPRASGLGDGGVERGHQVDDLPGGLRRLLHGR